jgi:putative acetyltransferase
MPDAITFADYGPADLVAVSELWMMTWSKTMPHIDFEARRGWLADHLKAALAKGTRIRLAMKSGRVAGFVMLDPETSYLDQLAVHPDFWGGVVANALMEEARRLSPERIVLDVNLDNVRAVAFYQRAGFKTVAEGVNPRSGLKTLKMAWEATPQRPPSQT